MRREIMNKLAEAVKRGLGEEYDIWLQKVEKNNGQMWQAIVIRKLGERICPTIYIDSFLDKIEEGIIGILDAAEDIVDICMDKKTTILSTLYENINKEKILEKVVYQIIGAERNIERLKDLPHKNFLDLAAIYNVILKSEHEETFSITMDYKLCRKYGISAEELDRAARENTEREGFCIITMAEMLAEIAGGPKLEASHGPEYMYIGTNKARNNGAVILLYDNYLLELAKRLRSDLYILPSSIHEVLLLPTKKRTPFELREMLIKVNSLYLEEEEVLGESVYKYNLKDKKLTIISDFGR